MKSRRPVHAVAIGDRHASDPALRAYSSHLFRQARAFEEAECRPRMEFDIHRFSKGQYWQLFADSRLLSSYNVPGALQTVASTVPR